jgi:hypothetical protein
VVYAVRFTPHNLQGVKAKGGMGIVVFEPIEIDQMIGKVRLTPEQCELAYSGYMQNGTYRMLALLEDSGSLLSTLGRQRDPESDLPNRPPVLARTDLVDPRAGDDDALALTEQYGSSTAIKSMRKNPNFRNT